MPAGKGYSKKDMMRGYATLGTTRKQGSLGPKSPDAMAGMAGVHEAKSKPGSRARLTEAYNRASQPSVKAELKKRMRNK